MTNQEIKVGDIVMLKSGGPEMTVIDKVENSFMCKWFHEGEVKKETFNSEELCLPEPKPVAPTKPVVTLGY